MIGGEQCPAELTKAKTAFARELAASPVVSQIVNPPGYFSDMTQILQMARRGKVFLFDPKVRINPIHGADLARFCVDRMEAGQEGQWDIGGPEVFTWESLAQCAFQALDRPTKLKIISARVLPPLIKVLGLFSRRRADTVRFVTWRLSQNVFL